MKSNEITACVKFEYSHAPFDLSKVIELTEKINEILIEVDPSLRGKLSVKKHHAYRLLKRRDRKAVECSR